MKAPRKLQTLRNGLQFRQVYEQGQKFHTPYFSAFFLRNGSGQQRYGITVTRKIGGAVVRNLCKRRLREIMRKHQQGALNQTGFDLVINVKHGLNEADFKQLESAFSQVMKKFHGSAGVK